MRAAFKPGIILFVFVALAAAQTPDPTRQAALALEQQGKNPEAEVEWRAYLKTHPADPEPYGHLALLAARQEHYKEAVPLYRKALAMNPRVPGLRLNLGLALFKSGDLSAALPEFKLALQEAPGGSAAAQRLTILIGMAHYGLAQYAEAVPFLKQATADDPQSLPLRLALAHSCLWSRQLQCVMDVYHEILTLNSESAGADMLAGEALDAMKDSAGATQMFRAAVKANAREPNAHFGLGYLLWTQKLFSQAAEQFRAELANDPNHVQSMIYLADTEIQLNQPSEARPLLEKAVKIDASQSMAHLDLGILYGDAGSNDEALRELTLAAKLKPDDINVHWRLGKLYRAVGKKAAAQAEFDKASRINRAADEDLLNKIANGRPRPAQESTTPDPSAQP